MVVGGVCLCVGVVVGADVGVVVGRNCDGKGSVWVARVVENQLRCCCCCNRGLLGRNYLPPMCVFVRECMSVCMCVCIYIYMYVYTYIYMYVYVCICI